MAAWPWLLLAHLLLPLRLLMALEEEAQEEVVGRGLLVEATRARESIGSHHRKRSLGARSSSTGTRKDSDLMNQYYIKVHLKTFVI